MFTISINHLLEVAEQQAPNTIAQQLLFIAESGIYFSGGGQPLFRNLAQSERFNHPLTSDEERRLNALDRKAKGGLLSNLEDIEFEKLLEIRRLYGVLRNAQPSLAIIRA